MSSHPYKEAVHPSMHRRMDGWDYSQPRIYMVTLAVEGRRPLLGRLVGRADAPAGSADVPRIELSALGRWVNGEVERIPVESPEVRVLGKQVMPDHVHILLQVTRPMAVHLGNVVGRFKAGCNRGYREITGRQSRPAPDTAGGGLTGRQSRPAPDTAGGVGCPSTRSAGSGLVVGGAGSGLVVGGAGSALAARGQGSGKKGLLWEAGYHDRVLSHAGQLQNLIDYIHDNPRRLAVKRANSPFFRRQTIAVGGAATMQAVGGATTMQAVGGAATMQAVGGAATMQAVGNVSLLQAPRRLAVRLSRRLSDDEIAVEVERLLSAGRSGTVLISPFISRGERAVLEAAAAEQLPLVHLLENGFPPYYKPAGAAFDAVADGRLLLLAPWPYHTERSTITREQCNALNAWAAALAC